MDPDALYRSYEIEATPLILSIVDEGYYRFYEAGLYSEVIPLRVGAPNVTLSSLTGFWYYS